MRIGDKLKRYISITNNGVNLINNERYANSFNSDVLVSQLIFMLQWC
jgi:hypothetical protein